ncbi:MAG: hypothetical protein Hyperionvirus4_66 [Hyperionvirus sp.]|uniref:Uncharacterized protein n=1 Tax=Hyperionvirus sp. TaxID=2487770 RepID=A0A3G5AA66_9VIRU|nr:MAG: hypothetical protein Hyperionvirus4_66 [Hyperionvirus sp.]
MNIFIYIFKNYFFKCYESISFLSMAIYRLKPAKQK